MIHGSLYLGELCRSSCDIHSIILANFTNYKLRMIRRLAKLASVTLTFFLQGCVKHCIDGEDVRYYVSVLVWKSKQRNRKVEHVTDLSLQPDMDYPSKVTIPRCEDFNYD